MWKVICTLMFIWAYLAQLSLVNFVGLLINVPPFHNCIVDWICIYKASKLRISRDLRWYIPHDFVGWISITPSESQKKVRNLHFFFSVKTMYNSDFKKAVVCSSPITNENKLWLWIVMVKRNYLVLNTKMVHQIYFWLSTKMYPYKQQCVSFQNLKSHLRNSPWLV